MNLPKLLILHAAFLAALTLPASAAVSIDFVTVGNAGNTEDPATGSRSLRGTRGGSNTDDSIAQRRSEYAFIDPSSGYLDYQGFRLASAIPESTTGLLAILGLFPLLSRRRKD